MRIKMTASLLLAVILSGPLSAELPTAREIVSRAHLAAYYAGHDGRTEARMQIVDGRGREQTRQFTMLRRNGEKGEQHYLVVFSHPADVRGTTFLVHKRPGADDHRWLYLPGLDLVRRIAPGDKRTSFVGSHFFYEDVSGRHLEDDEHTLADVTDEHYVIRSTPMDSGTVEFAAYTTWIDRETWLPARAEYENAQGNIYRRMEVLEIEQIQGYPTATRMRMSDLDSGGHTLAEMRFTAYDLEIPEGVFSERSLRNPPRKWLRRP
ncbi:outer membrane lipoprotein-sorting protein [Thioalkalivibrio thiocyanodenitrificans]|uniref:outer membrane lipoprotein-sorting protein n=1 Tax=Thioalkalivibrio thiocyanodenitrificans TaxID=243063 RepID=UPI0003610450|nr:outer membrane lipoprotein-sorting protein [Thioalkalivibrio thiocyanodenitrificans]